MDKSEEIDVGILVLTYCNVSTSYDQGFDVL